MNNIAANYTENTRSIYRYHLHYITLIKGVLWCLSLVVIALYLPNLIWNNKIFSVTLGADFIFKLFTIIIIKQEFEQLSYFMLAVWGSCWLIMVSAPFVLAIYTLRFFDTAIEIESTILTYKKGLIFISEREIDIRDIEEIFVNSGVFGALLNYGYLTFVAEGDRFTIPNIKNPKDMMHRLNHLKSMHTK